MALVIDEWLPQLQRLAEARRRRACRLLVCATLLIATQAVAQDAPAVPASQAWVPASEPVQSAEAILPTSPASSSIA